MMENDWNDYRMTASSHPKRVLELYRDCFFWRWNDAGMTGYGTKKKSEQILIASIPVTSRHPGGLLGGLEDDGMTRLGLKPMEFPHPCPSRHPQTSVE